MAFQLAPRRRGVVLTVLAWPESGFREPAAGRSGVSGRYRGRSGGLGAEVRDQDHRDVVGAAGVDLTWATF